MSEDIPTIEATTEPDITTACMWSVLSVYASGYASIDGGSYRTKGEAVSDHFKYHPPQEGKRCYAVRIPLPPEPEATSDE